MATSTPGDPLQFGIDVPPLGEARAAFLEHQAKRPKRPTAAATPKEIADYDHALTAWVDQKGKLSLRLELAQSRDQRAWKPCALPDHPCPQPETLPEPQPTLSRPVRLLRQPPSQEAPMTKGDYERMKRTPEERLAGLIETFRASRTPSSQRNAKQRMREICREFNLPLPLEAKQTVPNTPKAQPETTGAIAALPSSAQAAKGAPAPGSAAINQPFDPSTTPAQAALRRMRKEGWLLLAAAETLSRTERQALKENLELVRSQLDMALSLVGGAA